MDIYILTVDELMTITRKGKMPHRPNLENIPKVDKTTCEQQR